MFDLEFDFGLGERVDELRAAVASETPAAPTMKAPQRKSTAAPSASAPAAANIAVGVIKHIDH